MSAAPECDYREDVPVKMPEEVGEEKSATVTRLPNHSMADSGLGLTVPVLRELLRNLLLWRSVYESDGVEIITLPDGITEVSIHDIEFLLLLARDLPIRHRQAIWLCLIYNKSEEDAARCLHVEGANPVSMYATAGLQTILTAFNLNLAPSRAKVYAREAIIKNRSALAEVEEFTDYGPGVNDMNYEEF